MIQPLPELCSGCGLCAKICHIGCIRLTDRKITIDSSLCSTCTQCIAVCPSQALTWNGTVPTKIDCDLLPKPDQIKEFLKERRSVRRFEPKPVDRELLRDIALMSKYAPTNNYGINVIIVDDADLIARLEAECIGFIGKTYRILYKHGLIFNTMRKLTPAVNRLDKIKTERVLKRGNIFQEAPALMVLVADPRIYHTELSCQYVLYNMALYAQSLGLGSCISGAGKMILSRNKPVKKLLNIPVHQQIVGILFLGYPAVRFQNKVEGIGPEIQWNTGN